MGYPMVQHWRVRSNLYRVKLSSITLSAGEGCLPRWWVSASMEMARLHGFLMQSTSLEVSISRLLQRQAERFRNTDSFAL